MRVGFAEGRLTHGRVWELIGPAFYWTFNAMLATKSYVSLKNIVFSFHCKQITKSNLFEKTDFIRLTNNNRIIVFVFQAYDNRVDGFAICGSYTRIPNHTAGFDFIFGSQLLVYLYQVSKNVF